MILMGDGSSKILNLDSLKDFDGNFPANVFVLNPPYSAAGNGMIFVEAALEKMKSGYAAIIIQNSAGTGKAIANANQILTSFILVFSMISTATTMILGNILEVTQNLLLVGLLHTMLIEAKYTACKYKNAD